MNLLDFTRNNARWLGAGALLAFASCFGQTFFISIFADQIRGEFNLTNGQWGGIYTLGTTTSAVLMIWAGATTDRYRARTLGAVCLIAIACACILMSLVHTLWVLPLIIIALRLLGQGMLSHISTVSMARWFVASRGKALAISSLGYAFGEALLPLIFAILLTTFYWRNLWFFSALAAVVMVPALMRLLRTERTPQSVAKNSQSMGVGGKHWSRSDVLRSWVFWLYVPSIFGSSMWGTALLFQQVHIASVKGWTVVQYVSLFPIYSGVGLAAMLAAGWAIDKYSSRALLPYYQIPMVAGALLLAWGTTLPIAGLAFVALGMVQGVAIALPAAFLAEHFGTKHLGAIKALATAIMVFGSAIGPGITGVIIDWGVNFPAQLPFISLYVLMTCLLNWELVRRLNRSFAPS
jgi:MFS family permease